MTAQASSAREYAVPVSAKRDVAVPLSSSGKESGGLFTLMPMPIMIWRMRPLSPSIDISVRIPANFFPPRKRSLTHLIPGCTPQTVSTALASATAVQAVTGMEDAGGVSGRRRQER